MTILEEAPPLTPKGRVKLSQAQHRTGFVIDTLGSGAKLAALLGVNRSQPSQWRKGAEMPSPDTARVLLDLDHVIARATMIWSPEVVQIWLTSPNAFLNDARPIDVLRHKGSTDVITALDAELAGAYA